VSITSPTNNQVLTYDSASSLWVNANNTADGVTSITATAPLTGGTITSTGSIGLDQTALSITRSQVSDFTSGTVTSASTAQQAGTAVFATTSGTSVSISGSITRSQVSDYAAGTVANISGTVTQSQVTNLVSDLALKAPLASPTFSGTVTFPFTNSGIVHSGTAGVMQVSAAAPGLGYIPYTAPVTGLYSWLDLNLVTRDDQANTFTVGPQTINTGGTANKGLVVIGAASQAVNLFEVQTSAATAVRINQAGNTTFVGNITSQNNATFTPASSATVPLTVQGAASQTANLQEWRNSAGTVLSRIDLNGSISVPFLGSQVAGASYLQTNADTQSIAIFAGAAASKGVVIRGAASQSANLQEWQNSGGTAVANITSVGNILGNQIRTINSLVLLGEQSSGGRVTITRSTAAVTNPGANQGSLYFRDGTNAGTLKLVVRAGAAGAETTILDNIPQT
jgi:hypothetical protein